MAWSTPEYRRCPKCGVTKTACEGEWRWNQCCCKEGGKCTFERITRREKAPAVDTPKEEPSEESGWSKDGWDVIPERSVPAASAGLPTHGKRK